MNINNWSGLQVFGVHALTGEACRYGDRLLCDLNEDGVAFLTELFGLQIRAEPNTVFAPNWNSTVGDKPAIASIMLHRDMFGAVCKFALFHVAKCRYAILQPDGSWVGYTDKDIAAYKITESKLAKLAGRVYRNPVHEVTDSSRNTHQFTGRTE